jgi:hypothetical protein
MAIPSLLEWMQSNGLPGFLELPDLYMTHANAGKLALSEVRWNKRRSRKSHPFG